MNESSSSSSSSSTLPSHKLELPGFRFHPTEEELLNFYLRSIVYGKKLHGDVIGFLNIYKHHPRELPGIARIKGEREWYFFVPRDRKQGSGGRPNRTTENGFWKATGSDRKILSLSDPKKMLLGVKKTLVFYEGRAPRGIKTDWIMNEYRLPDAEPHQEIVLCKIYRKATSLKVLEQRAATEDDETKTTFISPSMYFEDVSFAMAGSCDGWRENLADLQLDWNWTFENLTPFMPMC